MKNLIMVISLVATALITTSSYACQEEAQFMGTIKNKSADCSLEISFETFNSSTVCPLEIEDVDTVRFENKNCSFKVGDSVSGVLVKKDNQIVIEE